MDLLDVAKSGSYMLNPNSTGPIFVACLALIFGLFVYRLDEKSSLNRAIFYFCISASIWMYGHGFLICSVSYDAARFWVHGLYFGLIFAAVAVFHISVVLSHRYAEQKPFLIGMYSAAGVFSALTFHSSFLDGLRRYSFGFYPVPGLLQFALLVFLLLCFVSSFVNVRQYYFYIHDGFERKKSIFFILAIFILSLGYSDLLVMFNILPYPSGYFAVFGFTVSVTFFILRYHHWVVDQRAAALETIIKGKTGEITKILEELRTVQVKLFETGKISALASLSAGILHQISQPITAIHGFVRFIKKEMDPKDQFHKPICLMEEQTVYLKEMLEDLMALVRHREIKKEDVDVNEYIAKATNLLTDELRIKRVMWDVKLEENMPNVHADGIHLQQIFMNLMINALQAIDALPRGSKRELTIASRFDKNNNRIAISFQDSGPGLSDEEKRQIFEPFFSTKEKGSGIGLALCKDLVAEFGGSIDVESTDGTGAKFIIHLPCVRPKT